MFKRSFNRLAQLLVTLLLVMVLLFVVFYVLPGDPVQIMLGVDSDPERAAILRENLGMDGSPIDQFVRMFTGLFSTSNPTKSIRFDVAVKSLVLSRLPVTLGLALMAFVMVILLAIPFGIMASRRPGGTVDRLITVGSQALLSLPGFFSGILLTWVFGVILRMYLPGRYVAPQTNVMGYLSSLFLPALALAIPKLAVVVQFQRDRLVALHSQEWVKTARGKGATERGVLFRHLFRNSLVPVVTTLGIVLAELIAGSLVVEQVFRLPGMGLLMMTAIEARDYPLVMGMVLLIAMSIVLINLVTDLLIRVIDPRLRKDDPDRLNPHQVLGPVIADPNINQDVPVSTQHSGGQR